MEKKNYNVRDALPDTPDTFYDAVERSLSACKEERKTRTWGLVRLPRKLSRFRSFPRFSKARRMAALMASSLSALFPRIR